MISRIAALQGAIGGALCAVAVSLTGPAAAQAPSPAPVVTHDFWSIELGTHALELDASEFTEYACGTKWGPPAMPLKGWQEYAKCRPEAEGGLREVQFRYDDETEYYARAYEHETTINASGTRLYIIPTIVSALFDGDGFIVGMRAYTDPRVPAAERQHSFALRNFLVARFGSEGWDCVDSPPAEGETPLGSVFIKQRCTKLVEGMNLTIESNYFRKPGQYMIDPRTGLLAEGLFRSDTQFEMMLAGPVPDRQARLAALEAAPRPPTPREEARLRALDCAGCDLSGIDLKRQDLSGANLAGANLSGANLHGALLIGADLTGANLADAILTKSNLRQAKLPGATLTNVLLYGAILEGADLSGSDLSYSKMQVTRLTRANLSGARIVAVDLSRSRLTNTDLHNANLGGAWLMESNFGRADLSGADLLQAVLTDAVLTDANLSGANFVQADLWGADLRGADLTGADFRASRLTQALMTNTNRQDARFENAVGLPQ